MKQKKQIAKWIQKNKTELFIFGGITCVFTVIYGQIYPFLMAGSPDEFGALAGGTLLLGWDWTGVTGTSYYGYGFTILLTPLFLIQDAVLRYFLLHCINASILGGMGVIGYKIMYYHLSVDNKRLCIMSTIAAACYESNLRIGKYVYNELPLNFSVWIVLYILMLLHKTESSHKKRRLSVLLALTLGYSVTIHTRAVITIIIVCAFMLLYFCRHKKNIVVLSYFLVSLLICLSLALYSSEIVKNHLFHALTADKGNANDIFSAVTQGRSMLLQVNIQKIFSFFISIISRLWTLYVLSGGVFVILTCILVKLLKETLNGKKKGEYEASSLKFMATFVGIGIIISMVIFTWNKADSITVGFQKGIVNRQFFYIRYTVLYWIPGILIVFAYLYKKQTKNMVWKCLLVCMLIISTCCFIIQPLLPEAKTYNKVTGTAYFVPFTFNTYDSSISTLYTYNSIALILLLGLISICWLKNKLSVAALISIVCSFYLFLYLLYFDSIPKTQKWKSDTDICYTTIRELEKYEDIGTDIYCVDVSTRYKQLIQFGLAEYHIVSAKIDIINEIDKGIIISSKEINNLNLNFIGNSDFLYIYLYNIEY